MWRTRLAVRVALTLRLQAQCLLVFKHTVPTRTVRERAPDVPRLSLPPTSLSINFLSLGYFLSSLLI